MILWNLYQSAAILIQGSYFGSVFYEMAAIFLSDSIC